MFTTFHAKYPEYEVITPQTKLSFTVRSLTVSEEATYRAQVPYDWCQAQGY